MSSEVEIIIIVIAGAVFAVVAVSGRLYKAWLTEPMVAMVVGILIGAVLNIEPVGLEEPVVLTFLELTLALVLFADAARIDVAQLRLDYAWPTRMLVIGMPLAMLGGALAGWWLIDEVSIGIALLIGVILAPTDAALAEPVLEAEHLPVRIRQTLNIESGLNDGLALPALFIAVGVEAQAGGNGAANAIGIFAEQVGLGVVGGLVLGYAGALIIGRGTLHGWMSPLHQKIAAVALALLAFAAVQTFGGSGFVATFVTGAVLAARVRPRCEYLYEFAKTEGRTLVLVAFVIIGAGPARAILTQGVQPAVWALVLVSLFVIRPLAIAVSLIGQKLLWSTTAFLGWFGPRGLATVVFLLVAFERLDEMSSTPDEMLSTLSEVVVLAVVLSVFIHGLSATPLASWLSGRIEAKKEMEMPEMGGAHEHPTRTITPPSPR